MAKPEIHPKWFPEATVLCDGKPLCTIGSTKKRNTNRYLVSKSSIL
jgi:ribosomal protein L31